MRRFMIVGATGAGKTTLLHVLTDDLGPIRKTQMVDYGGEGIDTPGEYAEMGRFRHRLMAMASDATLLLVVQDGTRSRSCFPPGFLLSFPRPSIGLVSKIDLPDADVGRAEALLRESGVRGEIHPVSATTGTGIAALRQRLNSCLSGQQGVIDNGKCSG
ncbi:ethanolamine utilization protein EutP [Siculibacillus lacustris]|uniref:Ethanolamine utilization protein EutP n=1 Tax=Siculibacillus lacustris TaxID=1549641 RepID=A0A4Q9VN47_9HYPH|nr:ethanolamine utilization protein EutP [Siculibacillus lacustris]